MNLKAWFTLIRPFTLIAPFIAVLFGVIIQLSIYNNLDIFWDNFSLIVFASLALASAQAVGQITNQVEDIEIDKVNGKTYRPLVKGILTEENAQIVAWIFAIFSILIGFSINTTYGLFMIVFLLFGVLYNIEPFRLKKRLWINTGSLAISRGLLPLPAAWSIFGSYTDLEPWLLGTVMAIWVLGWQNTKDINDVEGDTRFGMITPASYYGIKKLSSIIIMLSALSFSLLILCIISGAVPANMFVLIILAIPTLWMITKLTHMNFSKSSLENNELWAGFYLTLAGFYIIGAASFLVQPYISLFG